MTEQEKTQLNKLRKEMKALGKLLDEVQVMTDEQCLKAYTCSKDGYYRLMTHLLSRKEDEYNALIEQGKGEVF